MNSSGHHSVNVALDISDITLKNVTAEQVQSDTGPLQIRMDNNLEFTTATYNDTNNNPLIGLGSLVGGGVTKLAIQPRSVGAWGINTFAILQRTTNDLVSCTTSDVVLCSSYNKSIGICTNTPSFRLDVLDPTDHCFIRAKSAAGGSALLLETYLGAQGQIRIVPSTNPSGFFKDQKAGDMCYLSPAGHYFSTSSTKHGMYMENGTNYVGINNVDPTEWLDVTGSVKATEYKLSTNVVAGPVPYLRVHLTSTQTVTAGVATTLLVDQITYNRGGIFGLLAGKVAVPLGLYTVSATIGVTGPKKLGTFYRKVSLKTSIAGLETPSFTTKTEVDDQTWSLYDTCNMYTAGDIYVEYEHDTDTDDLVNQCVLTITRIGEHSAPI